MKKIKLVDLLTVVFLAGFGFIFGTLEMDHERFPAAPLVGALAGAGVGVGLAILFRKIRKENGDNWSVDYCLYYLQPAEMAKELANDVISQLKRGKNFRALDTIAGINKKLKKLFEGESHYDPQIFARVYDYDPQILARVYDHLEKMEEGINVGKIKIEDVQVSVGQIKKDLSHLEGEILRSLANRIESPFLLTTAR